jgi:hypothetical protein
MLQSFDVQPQYRILIYNLNVMHYSHLIVQSESSFTLCWTWQVQCLRHVQIVNELPSVFGFPSFSDETNP